MRATVLSLLRQTSFAMIRREEDEESQLPIALNWFQELTPPLP